MAGWWKSSETRERSWLHNSVNTLNATGLHTWKWLIICYVTFPSIIEKMKGQDCKIITMVQDDLDTLRIFDEVNVKRATFIPCVMVHTKISTEMIAFVPPNKPRTCRWGEGGARCSVSDVLFLQQAGITAPAWRGLPPSGGCCSLARPGPCFRESPQKKGLLQRPM